MQRRLTLAFVAMALTSIVLLGSGVLALSQFGARRSAEADLAERLEAFAEASNEAASLPDLARTFEQTRRFYNLSELQIFSIDAQGQLTSFGQDRGRNRPTPAAASVERLNDAQLASFQDGKPVFVGNDSAVTGLIKIEFDGPLGALPEGGNELAILASQPVPIVRGSGAMWYLISAVLVLLLSVAVAWIIARRMTRPIKEIQLATAEIAKGRLQTRVEPRSSDELGQLAVSVNQMAADLQRSKTLDRQFLMSVSHDLRTPLTAMRGYGEALVDGTATSSSRAGEVIVHHADRLNRLVTDLIDLARLDANTFQLHLETANLSVVVGRTIAGLQEAATQRALNLTFNAPSRPVQVALDVDRIGQVVTNLVHNALKYAETKVGVSIHSEDAGVIYLEVVDDGPGIDPDDLPHIFDRLYTSKNHPKVAESSGLGLTIVHELVEAMGGAVRATSTVGVGTQMRISFPTAAATATTPPSNMRQVPDQ